MKRRPSISIIGPGKVGTAIGVLAARGGYPVVAVGGRSIAKARTAARRIGHGAKATTPARAAAAGDIVFLTVPDRTIAPLAAQLAKAGAFSAGATVVHCSGALGSDILAPAVELCGCRVASFHPLMTFPTAESAIAQMKGTYVFLEGDAAVLPELERLAKAIGTTPVRLGQHKRLTAEARRSQRSGTRNTRFSGARSRKTMLPEAWHPSTVISASSAVKALYHASACVASNYLVTLMDAAVAIAEKAGLDRRQAWVALAPLIEATLNNITRLGPAAALTGPISRGDAGTVERHLAALAGDPTLLALYRLLGVATVELALRKKSIGRAEASRLRKLLEKTRGSRRKR